MDAIEQAIRNAFEKGDPADPAFREKVYRSAYAALERSLQGSADLQPEAVARRRETVIAAIGAIEARYAAAGRVARPAPTVEVKEAAAEVRVDPGFDGPVLDEPRSGTNDRNDWTLETAAEARRIDGPTRYEDDRAPIAAGRADRSPSHRRRVPWGLLSGLAVALLVVGIGYWTVVELGLIGAPRNVQGQAPTASAPLGPGTEGAPRRPGENDALEDWITVFAPADPTTVSAASGARAEIVEDGGAAAMRIQAGSTGAAVRFDVGQGTLERLAGKRAVFDIVARAAAGAEGQMSVSCDFGGLGDCGRNRYSLGPDRSEYLFEVDIPAGEPTGAGTIAIVSDVAAGGVAADVFQIRVTTVEPAPTN